MDIFKVDEEFGVQLLDYLVTPRWDIPSKITSLLPFHEMSSESLRNELWAGGGRTSVARSNWDDFAKFRRRGNYVKGYILSNLRIHAKSSRLQVSWNLDGIFDRFPTELICLIYSLLHPIDLYHAIRATKGLRCFLLDKSFSFIWKESFLNHPDIPFYPEDVSAPRWASLIFGPETCDSCDRDDCHVNYALRNRKCRDCSDVLPKTNHKLISAIRRIIGDFPNKLRDIWGLAIKVYEIDSDRYSHVSESVFVGYSTEQVIEVARKMRKYLLDIRLGTTEARSNYEAYVNATKALIIKHEEHAEISRRWAYGILESCHTIFTNSLPAFSVMSKKALLKRGHDVRDVDEAISQFNRVTRFSLEYVLKIPDPWMSKSKISKYIQILESFVRMARRTRIIIPRKKKINEYYNLITKNQLTSQAMRYIPRPNTTEMIDMVFGDYINNTEEEVGQLDYKVAEPEIQRFLQMYLTTKRCQMINLLQKKGLLVQQVNDASGIVHALELAVAVFECCGKLFIGFDEAGMHFCGIHTLEMQAFCVDSFAFSVSDAGYRALVNIVDILGLGLESLGYLTQANLDDMNKRFVCRTCPLFSHGGVRGLLVLTWRECLDHALDERKKHLDQHTPFFDVLSDALTTHLLACNNGSPTPSDRVWTCRYCTKFDHWRHNPLQSEAEAIDHALKLHDIAIPLAKVDFSIIRSKFLPKRFLNFVGFDENANHQCLRCSPLAQKLWLKHNLYQHLYFKHGIKSTDLVEGIDWKKIKAVEDDSWIN
ncbi:hypothetical protein BDN70DRAFT_988128 [Pholiota conissans]|uniref:F-box domain-containing protein n=1 Tax=Pholiota conissans TaxID=109636 RepID=A0A9P5ZES1_9AGAR|nr:hypothetical protein BDN70DRAFT_988128 [Pholiota conissans]